MRLEESRRAAQIIGKGLIQLDFLGFSDGSLYASLVGHWRHNQPMRSDFTGFDHVPYRDSEDWGKTQDWSKQPQKLPDDLPLRGHSRECLSLTDNEIRLKREALAQYQTQQRAMGDFLSAFVRKTECFTVLNPASTHSIENVLEHWRHVRKQFDNHPLSRRLLTITVHGKNPDWP